MKTLKEIIQEKLKINSKSKVNTIRYLSKKDMPSGFWKNFQCKSAKDLNEIENDVDSRNKSPQELINKITYKEQLFSYWFQAITTNWEEGYDIFRQEIINKGYATEDELDAYIIDTLDTFKDWMPIKNYLLNYLDKYGVNIK